MKTELKKSLLQDGKVEVYEGQLYSLKLIDDTSDFLGKVIKRKRPLFEKKSGDFIPSLHIKHQPWEEKRENPVVSVGTTSYSNLEKHEVQLVAENLMKGIQDAEAFEVVLKEMEEYNKKSYDEAMGGN